MLTKHARQSLRIQLSLVCLLLESQTVLLKGGSRIFFDIIFSRVHATVQPASPIGPLVHPLVELSSLAYNGGFCIIALALMLGQPF